MMAYWVCPVTSHISHLTEAFISNWCRRLRLWCMLSVLSLTLLQADLGLLCSHFPALILLVLGNSCCISCQSSPLYNLTCDQLKISTPTNLPYHFRHVLHQVVFVLSM